MEIKIKVVKQIRYNIQSLLILSWTVLYILLFTDKELLYFIIKYFKNFTSHYFLYLYVHMFIICKQWIKLSSVQKLSKVAIEGSYASGKGPDVWKP